MEVIGTIKVIEPRQQVSASFQKSAIVVSTDEQYAQQIYIEFTQDRCDLVDPYRVGEKVKVSINLRGREWINPQGEARYFNSIQGWRIERTGAAQPQQQAPAAAAPQASTQNFSPQQSTGNFTEEDHDDLPF